MGASGVSGVTPRAKALPQGELLSLDWVRLDALIGLRDNHKLHDIGAICESIRRYGFKDPLKWEPQLGDEGGVVEGNGRLAALRAMYQEGGEPPTGVLKEPDGMWLVPVLSGVDAQTKPEARAYAFDHNVLTLGGRIMTIGHMLKMFDAGMEDDLLALAKDGAAPQTVSPTDLEAMRQLNEAPQEYFADEDKAPWEALGLHRIVIVFTAREQAEDMFARLRVPFVPEQVMYRWEDYVDRS